ncbi:tol-pal system protein YbgF [Pseudomonas mangrovi]|uniref:Cell division coordinator CpoB n=1 Tax=Pseudomonas mangrovi TaxID=2161748 RepID=A0A2T5P4Y3_9PSED|nr:tol-pal system protein YbgF [Pseudomonas mangrovi]PTU72780.1 tol-pal system protein YbgF [Pseudomonas mangrovi]
MRTCRRALTVLALSLPLLAQAEIEVVEGGAGYGRQPTPSYGASGTYAVGGASAPTSAQGELFMQLQQMQQEIALLRGMLEEQQNQIQRLQQESLERYQELDRRVASGSGNAAAAGDGAINANATPTPPAQGGGEPADPAKEKLYYEAAFDLVKAKDFARANQAFSAFLRKYPNSQYAGNAQYWLGEVNLIEGDLQAAGQAFAKVAQNYPQHAKVPDALFKLADVEQRLGNTDKAKRIWSEVVAKYPGTSAAQLAQRNLQR